MLFPDLRIIDIEEIERPYMLVIYNMNKKY